MICKVLSEALNQNLQDFAKIIEFEISVIMEVFTQ